MSTKQAELKEPLRNISRRLTPRIQLRLNIGGEWDRYMILVPVTRREARILDKCRISAGKLEKALGQSLRNRDLNFVRNKHGRITHVRLVNMLGAA